MTLKAILCCSQLIIMDSRKQFPIDLTLYPERKLHFLCKFWAGESPTGHSNDLEFSEQDHLGIIAVTELNNDNAGFAVTRWFAPEFEYNKATGHDTFEGQDGGYFEVGEELAKKLIEVEKLAATSDRMQFGLCTQHPEKVFHAQWYHLGNKREVNKHEGPVLQGKEAEKDARRVDSIREKLESRGYKCGKCKKQKPAYQYEENIYTKREADNECTACQLNRYNKDFDV
jgi:hypothetical protein